MSQLGYDNKASASAIECPLCATAAFPCCVQIQAAHEALSAAYPIHSNKLKAPADAEALREQCRAFDPLMTFDAKHALQNGSIVGKCAGSQHTILCLVMFDSMQHADTFGC